MKIWTSLSNQPEDLRWARLSERLKNAGVPNEFRPWPGGTRETPDLNSYEDFDHVRIDPTLGPEVLKTIRVQSSWSTMLGVADGLVRTQGEWWPRCALVEALGQILIARGPELDTRGHVLLAGTGGLALAAVAAFFRAGFKKILVTCEDPAEGESLIKILRSHLFGLELEWVPMDRIVLLPGESSVLVNCSRAEASPQLLTELSYLNFLRRPGFVFDLDAPVGGSALLAEAKEAGVQTIHGREVNDRADKCWAEWAFGARLETNGEK